MKRDQELKSYLQYLIACVNKYMHVRHKKWKTALHNHIERNFVN